jgi:hypothetical protein
MRFEYLSQHPHVFRSVTGFCIAEFKELLGELRSFFEAHGAKRLTRPDWVSAPGALVPLGVGLSRRCVADLGLALTLPHWGCPWLLLWQNYSSVRRTLARFLRSIGSRWSGSTFGRIGSKAGNCQRSWMALFA